ncbi:MAG: class II aldolase/adducin family protein [Halohasta sp.]
MTIPDSLDSEELHAKRQTVGDTGRQMLEEGLTKATGGNVSSRVGDNHVAVSPSGVPYPDIEPEDVPLVDLDAELIDGDLEPSAETPMHTAVYCERDDVGGIIHTHSPYASTFASLSEPIEASHYLIAYAGDRVPVAPYETYGTEELGAAAAETLGDTYNACLLENHGVLTVGETIEGAFETALMVEYCARIHYQARTIGDPTILSDEEVDRLIERFASYRTQ